MVFITKFVTLVTKFLTCITKFVTSVTNFVIKNLCADSEKCLRRAKKNSSVTVKSFK